MLKGRQQKESRKNGEAPCFGDTISRGTVWGKREHVGATAIKPTLEDQRLKMREGEEKILVVNRIREMYTPPH